MVLKAFYRLLWQQHLRTGGARQQHFVARLQVRARAPCGAEQVDRQRQRRERDARRIERLTTPYSRAPDCTAQLDASKLAAIEELVAQRLAAKLRRDFAESDALLQRLLDSGVRVTDDHRLWRSDDRPFVVPYRQEGGGIPRLGTGGTTRIEALVLERDLFTAAGVKRRRPQPQV